MTSQNETDKLLRFKMELRRIVSLLITNLAASSAFAIPPCAPRVASFASAKSLYQEVAIVGDQDDRVPRTESFADNVEAAQGRIWCHTSGPMPKGDKIPKDALSLDNFSVSNATLAFEDGVAIVNRHVFVNEKGKQDVKFNKCFFEHIKSGEVIRIADAAYPKMHSSKSNTSKLHQSFAVVRLATVPNGGIPIRKEDIAFDRSLKPSDTLKVISNVADNNKDRNVLALTMTTCKAYGQYAIDKVDVPVFGTDCDTGDGSSGASVFIDDNGPKFAGIVSGEIVNNPENTNFNPHKLSTIVTAFDQSLIEAYDALKSRRGI